VRRISRATAAELARGAVTARSIAEVKAVVARCRELIA
jgi:hypothetical protein